MTETPSLTIAIDGPAASGKGTLARMLAKRYGLRHLDTGLTYRAVARALLQAGMALDDEDLAIAAARRLDFGEFDRTALGDHGVGEAASVIAVMPRLRAELVARQREFAARPPGAVLDGRDIGTVVCPDADVKFFVTASPETRARRRFEEIRAAGGTAEFGKVLEDIRRRDARDMDRIDSPLRPAKDAHLIDTTSMDIETAFRTALEIVQREKPPEWE